MMLTWLDFLPAVIPMLLVAAVLVPDSVARRAVARFRHVITVAVACQFAIAMSLLVLSVLDRPLPGGSDVPWIKSFQPSPTILMDGLSAMMLALISFVGWVTCQYSIRYLDGESNQSRYFRWAAFTIGSVSLMVLSGHLIILVMGWIATNLGLHQLLVLNQDREGARRAAWTKFALNRVGDAALITAVVLLYQQFGTFGLVEIFESARSMASGSIPIPTAMHAVCGLLVVTAVTQSVQFPFHTWLPETMESPTPVSALMHAGIVNAGGYLIIRFGHVFALSPAALYSLVAIGTMTACLGVVVMMTQTSVKKSLAYSTIAQMGFMMLQIGLGAYVAATLHLVAHSLYKANAFLRSGSVLRDQQATLGSHDVPQPVAWPQVALAATLCCTMLAITWTLFGISVLEKPGGLVLGGILCLALSQWVSEAMGTGERKLVLLSIVMAGVMCVLYAAGFAAVGHLIAGAVPTVPLHLGNAIAMAAVAIPFLGIFALQRSVTSANPPAWLKPAYVHASNGFYVEQIVRRLSRSFAST
ncbi:NADH-quinone oxidoreductase subunit L [Rubripirellula lacrimiformis]|uniref:Probable inorganic carbon transporter subunit DabB n=1 Tax=Rubripirellula lacrimiformis TaxID=1930273 RepID=A0A517NJR9_9BACT|nr:proton-conducting transporter membrane subunit [Rubripirellula lacrimiformis]QDT07375.1 NADH-quinone oxidoreductase subunit L [Rubripirellula lacrimiformis]